MMESQKTTKDVGIQTEIIQRDFIPPKILSYYDSESKAFPQILYKSHTLFLLFLSLFIVMIINMNQNKEELNDQLFVRNVRYGIVFAGFTFVLYGLIYLPNTFLFRPHPSFYRILHALGLIYVAMLGFAVMLRKDELQRFFKEFVDPKMGQPLPEKSYAENCDFYTPDHPESNFFYFKNSLDVFIPAHFIGWLTKMLIVRNVKICFLQSILFEILEITFRHWLNNFWECWWDHIILDLILCNSGGILAGWWLIHRFQMKKYKWSMKKDHSRSMLENVTELFSPNLETRNWKVFSSPKKFLKLLWFLAAPTSIFCWYRTWVLGFLAIPAVREYYEYLTNKLGPYIWNIHAIILLEWLLFYNNYRGQFQTPFPWYVKVIWAVIAVVVLTIFSVLVVNKKNKVKKSNGKEQ